MHNLTNASSCLLCDRLQACSRASGAESLSLLHAPFQKNDFLEHLSELRSPVLSMCWTVLQVSAVAGEKHSTEPMGQHPCHLAFVIQLSKLLREVQEGFLGEHEQLAQTLKVSALVAYHCFASENHHLAQYRYQDCVAPQHNLSKCQVSLCCQQQ